MKLKESETKLEKILLDNKPENDEVPAEETEGVTIVELPSDNHQDTKTETPTDSNLNVDKNCNVKNTDSIINNNLKKVTNIENEQLNRSMHSIRVEDETNPQQEPTKAIDIVHEEKTPQMTTENKQHLNAEKGNISQAEEEAAIKKDDQELNDMLRKNILSCVEKITRIEEMKTKKKEMKNRAVQVFVC